MSVLIFCFRGLHSKYLLPLKSSVFLTPSPTEYTIETPTSTGGINKCLSICNNNIFATETYEKLTIDTVDSMNKSNIINTAAIKHPGQAVKIITDDNGEHTVVKEGAEVRKTVLNTSKSCTDLGAVDAQCTVNKRNKSDSKSCDENLIKFIFTKHGIQVISDVETIV